ncbi:hypothetical protein EXN66_Car013466 [Channa argus]|uniref:Uncharacterized protein n=1 Tax=Channa argus TaxID=215402 RepID=A0A6G1Q5G8_CHAAH|nr:hypothetical protein EXN66_Car013466 [Channa argus]
MSLKKSAFLRKQNVTWLPKSMYTHPLDVHTHTHTYSSDTDPPLYTITGLCSFKPINPD